MSLLGAMHKLLYETDIFMSKQLEEEVAKAMEEARRQGKEDVRLFFNPDTCEFEPLIDDGNQRAQSFLEQFPCGEDF